MTIISSKSQTILLNIGIPTFIKRENLGQKSSKLIIFHKRDKVLALLLKPLEKYSKEEQSLFISIMNTMSSRNSKNEELSESFDLKSDKQLNEIIQKKYNKSEIIISFGLKAKLDIDVIQAPSLSSIISNPNLKRPLWEKIKKTLTN